MKALVNVLLGIFVCFMVPVMLVGMVTGDPYLQTLGGLTGIGFYVYTRLTYKEPKDGSKGEPGTDV